MSCDVVLAQRRHATDQLGSPEHVHIGGLAAPSAARRYLRERLNDLPEELVDTAELLTSEVVTNGILHGRTDLVFGVIRGHNEVLVTVADGNATPPGRRRVPTTDDELLQGGRGIGLIVALADDFGWRGLPDRRG